MWRLCPALCPWLPGFCASLFASPLHLVLGALELLGRIASLAVEASSPPAAAPPLDRAVSGGEAAGQRSPTASPVSDAAFDMRDVEAALLSPAPPAVHPEADPETVASIRGTVVACLVHMQDDHEAVAAVVARNAHGSIEARAGA